MALNVLDPSLKLLYGLDESNPTALRVNSAADNVASDHTLQPKNASGTEGLATVDDENGGRAVNTDPSPGTPWTTTRRWLQSAYGALPAVHQALRNPGTMVAGEGFVMGCRFKWPTFETGTAGGTDVHYLWGCHPLVTVLREFAISITPDTNTTPATKGRLRIDFGGFSDLVDNTGWTTTGTPPVDSIALATTYYRATVRVRYLNSTDNEVKVWLREESTGNSYTWTQNVTRANMAFGGSFAAETVYWCVGCPLNSSDLQSHYGYQDECWFYNATLSDADIEAVLISGISTPWVDEQATVNDHVVRVAVANESGTMPKPRPLPTGGLVARHTVNVFGQRFRLRYEGHRPGRPWALREIHAQFDTLGPYSARTGHQFAYGPVNVGLLRIPGQLPQGAASDVRNVEFSGNGARRRRGFKQRRIVSTTDLNSVNSFATLRDLNDQLFRMYKVGDKLFAETGTSSTQIDSLWNANIHPSYGVLDGQLVIISAGRRKKWNGNGTAVQSFGVTTPAAPTAAATVGTLTGTYYYLYTEYDPTTGDESAPGVLATPIVLAAQGALLTLAAVSSDTRFSQRRIYRTTSGGAATTATLIATVTSATSYTDASAADGIIAIQQVLGTYITGDPPATFVGCVVHKERMFYWTADGRLYWTEPNETMRFFSGARIYAEGPIRAAVSTNERLVMFTDNTTESIESDFERDSLGLYSVRRNVCSRRVGCPGPHAVVNADGEIVWLDRRGIYRLAGDKPQKITKNTIDNLFKLLNAGLADRAVGAVNHFRQQVWFAAPFAQIQEDNSRTQTVISLDLETWKPTIHQLEASFLQQFDDDLNGMRFGCIDHLGVFKEMESYEGDGAQGDESYTTEDADGISSISGNVITLSPTPGWVASAHRGKAIVFEDVSTGLLYYYMIYDNGTNTVTIVGTPSSVLAAGDGYYLGGMNAYIELAEQDFKSPNRKRLGDLQSQFDDLTAGRFV